MSFEAGMALTTIALVMAVVCFVIYLIADYTERKNYNNYMKYRKRVSDRQALRAEQEIKSTIWEATEFAVNNIKREMF